MARNVVQDIGTGGIIRDIKPQFLPSSVWSDGRNVRFAKDKACRMNGVSPVFSSAISGGVAGEPMSVGIATSALSKYLVYGMGPTIYSYDGTTQSNITRISGGDYSEDLNHLFQYENYNGLLLANNGVDLPQQWIPGVGVCQNLANWDANWTTNRMKQFRALLIAIGMVESAAELPHRLRWSHPADPGSVPVSWDAANPAYEAGFIDFSDTENGVLVNGLELNDRFYVYKEKAIWAMTYIGGQDIFSRTKIVDGYGLHVPRSLIKLPFTQNGIQAHFFAGEDGFFLMDGQRITPVFEDVFAREIKKLVNTEHYQKRSFSVLNAKNSELWFCVPEAGYGIPTIAFCLNFRNNTYSIRELGNISDAVSGYGIDLQTVETNLGTPFSDDAYFADNVGFSFEANTPAAQSLLEVSPDRRQIYISEFGKEDYDGNWFEAYLERVAIPAIKNDYRNPKGEWQGYDVRKMCSAVIPKLYEGRVGLEVGAQETDVADVTWTAREVLDTADYKHNLPWPVSGRFLSFRFSSVEDEEFSLGGFDYEIEVLGEY